jgi:DNA adenine methylase
MKPIFKYNGGKYNELPLIKKHYPENYDLFVEPFCGGAAACFDLGFSNNILNDANEELINFFQQLKNGNGERIYQLMKSCSFSKDEYYSIRNGTISDDLTRSFKFFYLRKTCFRGLIRYNRSGKFNVPYGNYKNINCDILLDANYKNLLNNTQLCNEDYKEIFDAYNDEKIFMFIDPPYLTQFKYSFEFTEKDQTELSELFKSSKSKCLMVIGEHPLIRELYEGFIVEEYTKRYFCKTNNNSFNKHLIVKNF